MYQLTNNPTRILKVDEGATFTIPAAESYGFAYERWLAEGNHPDDVPTPTPLTAYEKDVWRYKMRDSVKGQIIAEMASDNMARVRAGVWTVPELIGLASDPLLAQVQGYMATLSFELAAQALATSEHPLLTPEIKAGWIAKLQANFFLVAA